MGLAWVRDLHGVKQTAPGLVCTYQQISVSMFGLCLWALSFQPKLYVIIKPYVCYSTTLNTQWLLIFYNMVQCYLGSINFTPPVQHAIV